MTAGEGQFQCLDWKNPELTLRSRNIQSIDFMFMQCDQYLGFAGYQKKSYYNELYDFDWVEEVDEEDEVDEWQDQYEKECRLTEE